SDSDFQLELTGDSSEEVSLGELPVTPGGSGSKRSGDSGINLHKPSDSGVLLEKSPVKEPESSSDDEVDFELSLDVSSSSSRVSGGRPSSKNLKKEVEEEDSSGEFELTLDDSDEAAALQDQASGEEGQDIFETDFEIP